MITILISIRNNFILGQSWLLSSSMILIHHILIYWFQLVILLNINIFSINWFKIKKIVWFLVKLVLVNQLLSLIFSVWHSLINIHIQPWISQHKLILKMFLMFFLIKINLLKKEELKLDHLEVKKWYSLLMISICQHFKNMEHNLLMNSWDKLSIKVDFMILKNSCSCKFQIVFLSLLALHQVEVEIKCHQGFLDISTWYGHLIFRSSQWTLFLHLF